MPLPLNVGDGSFVSPALAGHMQTFYTSIFGMNVLSLNRIHLASEEDKKHRLDYWARVFRAETWEELKVLAEGSEAVSEVAEAMYKVSAEQHTATVCPPGGSPWAEGLPVWFRPCFIASRFGPAASGRLRE